MSESDLIERLAAAVAERVQPVQKIDDDLWSLDNIAAYLKRESSTVREKIACLPSFPKAIRLPSFGKGRSQPLYKEVEVRTWTDRFMEKN
jgi:hypothetical protein